MFIRLLVVKGKQQNGSAMLTMGKDVNININEIA
jgi:hypothetical protein